MNKVLITFLIVQCVFGIGADFTGVWKDGTTSQDFTGSYDISSLTPNVGIITITGSRSTSTNTYKVTITGAIWFVSPSQTQASGGLTSVQDNGNTISLSEGSLFSIQLSTTPIIHLRVNSNGGRYANLDAPGNK